MRKRERLHLSRWVHGIRRLPCRFFRRPLATIHAPCPVACRASLFYMHWCHYQRRQSLCLAVFTLVKHPRTMVWWQHHSLLLIERCIDCVSFDEKWIIMVGLSLYVGFYGRWKLLYVAFFILIMMKVPFNGHGNELADHSVQYRNMFYSIAHWSGKMHVET